MTGFNQFPGIFVVDRAAFGLTVWRVWPADIRAFIIVQSQPAQAFNQLTFGVGVVAFLVSIFDAQNECPTGAARQ